MFRSGFFNFLISIFFFTCFTACQNIAEKGSAVLQFKLIDENHALVNDSVVQSTVAFAKGFDIYNYNDIQIVVVYNPFLTDSITEVYFISPDKFSFNRSSRRYFTSPLDQIAVFSATQLNSLDKLKSLDAVIGISEAEYINNPVVREKIKSGEIVELSAGGTFFVEKTLQVKPSVIFHSPYKVGDSDAFASGIIPSVSYLDYLEEDPLGRAEWIKFTAVFMNKQVFADSVFSQIVSQYNELKLKAATIQYRPTIFSDKYFNGQWFVPGGASYISRLFSDAGADYVWKDNQQTASFPLDYEVVYEKAKNADFWRIIGSYNDIPSYDALAAENELYTHFKAFRQRKVLYCDPEKTSYFETSPLQPQIILADMIKAFHPELLPEYQPVYYKVLP